MVGETKKIVFNNVLIPWYPISYLMIASSVFFGGGAYGSLPDATIWWCLRTGGGGVLTSGVSTVLLSSHECATTYSAERQKNPTVGILRLFSNIVKKLRYKVAR